MTTTPPDAPTGPPSADQGEDGSNQSPQGPRATREEIRDLGRIRRTTGADRKVAGVAGGLARHLDIDPIILRVAFVVLVFFGGAGLLLYGACWLLLPEDGSASAPLSLDDRNRSIALRRGRRDLRAARPGRLHRTVRLPVAAGAGRAGRPAGADLRSTGTASPAPAPRRSRTFPTRPRAPSAPAAPGYAGAASPRRTSRGRATRAGAARSCSGSPWRWPHSASACSGSWTWPAPRSPTRRTPPWSSAPAA